MPLILLIETATTVCSVGLSRDGKLLSVREINEGYSHSENITVFIEHVCRESNVKPEQVDAIAVSRGPGSYTGLRIGASTAKGLCYALNKPLIAVDTLKSLAARYFSDHVSATSEVCIPMIDARRMEVYMAVYDSALNELSPADAVVVKTDTFKEFMTTKNLVLVGDGSSKCKPLFENDPRLKFADVSLSVKGMVSLAEEKFSKKEFEDVSLFQPFYLKEAVIGKAK